MTAAAIIMSLPRRMIFGWWIVCLMFWWNRTWGAETTAEILNSEPKFSNSLLTNDDVVVVVRTRDQTFYVDVSIYNTFDDLLIRVEDEEDVELCSMVIQPRFFQRTNCKYEAPTSLKDGSNFLKVTIFDPTTKEIRFHDRHYYFSAVRREEGLVVALRQFLTNDKVIGSAGFLALIQYGIWKYHKRPTSEVPVLIDASTGSSKFDPRGPPNRPFRFFSFTFRFPSSLPNYRRAATANLPAARSTAIPSLTLSGSAPRRLLHNVMNTLLLQAPATIASTATPSVAAYNNKDVSTPALPSPVAHDKRSSQPTKSIDHQLRPSAAKEVASSASSHSHANSSNERKAKSDKTRLVSSSLQRPDTFTVLTLSVFSPVRHLMQNLLPNLASNGRNDGMPKINGDPTFEMGIVNGERRSSIAMDNSAASSSATSSNEVNVMFTSSDRKNQKPFQVKLAASRLSSRTKSNFRELCGFLIRRSSQPGYMLMLGSMLLLVVAPQRGISFPPSSFPATRKLRTVLASASERLVQRCTSWFSKSSRSSEVDQAKPANTASSAAQAKPSSISRGLPEAQASITQPQVQPYDKLQQQTRRSTKRPQRSRSPVVASAIAKDHSKTLFRNHENSVFVQYPALATNPIDNAERVDQVLRSRLSSQQDFFVAQVSLARESLLRHWRHSEEDGQFMQAQGGGGLSGLLVFLRELWKRLSYSEGYSQKVAQQTSHSPSTASSHISLSMHKR